MLTVCVPPTGPPMQSHPLFSPTHLSPVSSTPVDSLSESIPRSVLFSPSSPPHRSFLALDTLRGPFGNACRARSRWPQCLRRIDAIHPYPSITPRFRITYKTDVNLYVDDQGQVDCDRTPKPSIPDKTPMPSPRKARLNDQSSDNLTKAIYSPLLGGQPNY
ncbi:MAG: hypothetical protein CYPHOPRED_004743 [Cyphobasidiales sp. Tagirdzhanova-0007]|nr:MAG: hypothetical protein CYPHOPRED_004743 [Cyphobasidiales sp. Tagirdzhanova-0007]